MFRYCTSVINSASSFKSTDLLKQSKTKAKVVLKLGYCTVHTYLRLSTIQYCGTYFLRTHAHDRAVNQLKQRTSVASQCGRANVDLSPSYRIAPIVHLITMSKQKTPISIGSVHSNRCDHFISCAKNFCWGDAKSYCHGHSKINILSKKRKEKSVFERRKP